MTDDAMTVAADAAPMPDAQVSSAPAETSQPSAPEPTPRGAIERAFAQMQEKNAAAPAATTEPAQSGRERNPDGTFKTAQAAVDAQQTQPEAKTAEDPTKAATPFGEAPTRFSPDAKAAWAAAPEPIKAEVTRAIKELEGGIQQYQAAFEPYKDFDKQIKANGQTFKEVFDHYTGIESLLAQDPIKGLDTICRNLGLSLEQVAAHVMGQPADQSRTQADAYINELKSEIAALKKEVGSVSTTIKSQQEKAILEQIDAFAADKPRFDELADTIAMLMNKEIASSLDEAYSMAERLNPAPVVASPAPAAPAATTPTASPQTRKGQLSPSGAPASGSNPASRKPPESPRDALQRAFASVGI